MKFGSYQQTVNNLTGAFGPKHAVDWSVNQKQHSPWKMNAQPLYFDLPGGKYVTSYDDPNMNLQLVNSATSFGKWPKWFRKSRSKSPPKKKKSTCGCSFGKKSSLKKNVCGCSFCKKKKSASSRKSPKKPKRSIK